VNGATAKCGGQQLGHLSPEWGTPRTEDVWRAGAQAGETHHADVAPHQGGCPSLGGAGSRPSLGGQGPGDQAQAGNGAGKTRRSLQWWDHVAEWWSPASQPAIQRI